ncbi:MAG: hypothetical protein KF788_10700 [Piscinibacter sp.]|nr:hypothetical protein [Piscinibacter sp.]
MLRYFLTYRGVRLPLALAEELAPDALRHRNTYFRAEFDPAGRVCWLEKLVYGEVEMRHDYEWSTDGRLVAATLRDAEGETVRQTLDNEAVDGGGPGLSARRGA